MPGFVGGPEGLAVSRNPTVMVLKGLGGCWSIKEQVCKCQTDEPWPSLCLGDSWLWSLLFFVIWGSLLNVSATVS